MEENNINLLLIGTSGNGVSSTANTIIGRNEFITSSKSKAVNLSVVKHSRHFNNLTINVVDIPGIDTDNSSERHLMILQSHIETAFKLCNNIFSALILVLKYGQRFTKQEKDTLKVVTAIFGKDVIKNNIICIFTHGDMFEKDVKYGDGNLTFEKWCDEQSGLIKGLFKKCDKCLIFNNLVVDNNTFRKQITKLLELTKSTQTYSFNDYKEAEKWLKPLKNEMALSQINKKTLEFLNKTRSEKLQIEMRQKSSGLINELENLLEKIIKFESDITTEVGEIPDKAKHAANLMQGLKLEIKSKIDLLRLEENLADIEKTLNPKKIYKNPTSLEEKRKFREDSAIESEQRNGNVNEISLKKRKTRKSHCNIL